ncbi:MAG: FHA domain-containing protein [Gammaproteobacteria bacterium]|nr:FHA domain-containing protein [Gammaproteobacteria bacterium]
MEALIIQVEARSGRVRELVRSSGDAVSIGRGLGNRIVLTDPYIAPDQASFQCEDGCWYFENHDNTNRVLLNNEVLSVQKVSLQSGDRLVLGRTEIQVFSPDHEVAATRKLLLSSWLHHDSIGFVVPMLALLGCNLLDFSVDYLLDATREVDWKAYVINLLWLNLFLLVWSGIWAVTGKLVRHQYHFGQQLFITAIWLIAIILVLPLLDYLDFVINGVLLSSVVALLVLLVMVARLVKFNLYFATSGRYATTIGIAISFVIVGGLSTLNFLLQEDFDAYAQTDSELYPGFTLFGSGASIDSYFGEVESKLEAGERE